MITPQSVIPDHVMLAAIGNSYGVYTRLADLLGTSVDDAKNRVQRQLRYQQAFKAAGELQDDFVLHHLLESIADGNVKAMQIYYDHFGAPGSTGQGTSTAPIMLIDIHGKADTSP